jgi:hypothetical protein
MDGLTEIIDNWEKAWLSFDSNYKPLTQQKVDELNAQLANPLPEAWKQVLLNGGWGLDVKFSWPTAYAGFKPSDAIEHQNETSASFKIECSGKVVIGYIHGIGDSIVIHFQGENPMVYKHLTDANELQELCKLSEFLARLTEFVNTKTNLKISDAIRHISEKKEYSLELVWGWNHKIRYYYNGKEVLLEITKDEFEILKKLTTIEPTTYVHK